MLDALLLIQDVQLLCFAIIFGFVSLQYRQDPVRRWLWFSFLANGAGALLDFASPHLPPWLGRGVNLLMIPLSYAVINVAVVHFLRRFRQTWFLSAAILLCTLPLLILWSSNPDRTASDGLVDLAIGLQSLATAIILLRSSERSTAFPRIILSGFFFPFAAIEIGRAVITFALHQPPDVWSHSVELTSSVAYIVSTSVLPLAFLWMINSRVESDLVLQNLMDPLTQVLNRRGLRQVLDREIARYAESGDPLAIGIVDLDYFKQLNDRYGHAAGDTMLVAVASLLRGLLRDTDTIARMGGEEFVLVLPNTDARHASALLERLRIEIEEHSEVSDKGAIRTTASFGGTATVSGKVANANDLLREADQALYCAKADGRNRVHFYKAEDALPLEPLRPRQRPA
jgi:diguanylate cyclase (GGDEF)-like protein